MARSPSNFSEKMTREFYASYAATVRNAISKRAKPLDQPPFQATLVQNFSVDISEATILRLIYSLAHTLTINTSEYDYRICIIQSGPFQRDVEQRETLLRLLEATKTLDIGLIRDDDSLAAPRREPHIDLPPLEAQAPPSIATSQAASSSRATPTSGSTLVPLARVQKLEAQMATLLQYMRPWMQRSVEESKARMEHMMDGKIQAVHKCLDAFELRVLERHAPTIDMTTFQSKLAKLCADVDAILAPAEVVPKTTPKAKEDEVVMSALFGDLLLGSDTALLSTLLISMRPDGQERESGRSSRSTTEGVPTVDKGATDSVPIADPVGSGKPDSPAS
uniref:Integrase core domain containing protein n=1 Tax=Solanum tuberosum TaxID=4113 RepID=M1DVY0_SOLTU